MRLSLFFSAVPLLASGCFLNHGNSPNPDPEIEIEASISAASLANDCGDSSAGEAPPADGEDGRFGPGAGDCAPGFDGCGFCQQSNAQILFDVIEMQDPLDVEVIQVRLLDSRGRGLQTLTARNPRVWREEYGAWDETLTMLGDLRTSYDLSEIDWATIGGGDPWTTYEMTFFLEFTIRIGDEEVVLRSDELMREPEIVT